MRPKRVLIADDDKDSAHALSELVLYLGHQVAVVESGRDALRAAGLFDPEVTILDLDMPYMDGFEAACALRERGPDALIVAITGLPPSLLPEGMMAACFDRHYAKPISVADLQALLEIECPVKPAAH